MVDDTTDNWQLNEKDSQKFVDAIRHPPEPNDALKAAAQRYQATDEIVEKVLTLLDGQNWTDEPLSKRDRNLVMMTVQATIAVLQDRVGTDQTIEAQMFRNLATDFQRADIIDLAETHEREPAYRLSRKNRLLVVKALTIAANLQDQS